ncbi:MAG TPA: ATP-binding protein [Candidatus Acidoferrales bacterium]|nr:ATP-binding protein [Candidatus Acidoferrales bacterium]
MSSPKAVLIVDANPEIASLVWKIAGAAEWLADSVTTNEAALEAVQRRHFDVVLTSEKTSAAEDVGLLRKIRRVHPHTRVIILAAAGTPAGVIAAMRENAFSYFTAPFALEQLENMLQNALEAPPWDDGIELQSATPSWIRLRARCDRSTAERLVQFVNEIGEELALDDRTDLSTAFREMLLNAMEHGGHFDPNEYIEISYLRSSRAVSCRIRDPGEGFSLKEIPHAAVSNAPDDPCGHLEHREAQGLRPGGFGILLTQNLVDEVIYSEKGNEVILIKHLDEKGARKSNDADPPM